MLQNEPSLAIVAVHTSENEPSEVGPALLAPRQVGLHTGPRRLICCCRAAAARQTLDASFSAVWTATIARKDAFFCIFRDLQDLHSFAPLKSQILQIFRNFFRENFRISRIFAKFC